LRFRCPETYSQKRPSPAANSGVKPGLIPGSPSCCN
jgi:hypothetical protein